MQEYQDIRIQKVSRGEIYYYKTTSLVDGSLQQRTRPILILSNDIGNSASSIALACYLTTSPKKLYLPTHCTTYATGKVSTVICEQIITVNQNNISGDCIGVCTENEMEDVEKCLIVSLGIKCNNKIGYKIIEKYLLELERQLKENNFIYDEDGYLTKQKIIRIPVIEKSSLNNEENERVHTLEVENARLKSEVSIYKEMLDKFMGTYMIK